MRGELDGEIEGLTDIYKNQGIHAGNKARKDMIRSMKRRVNPGGDIAELKNRKASFQAYAASLDEMRRENKISKNDYDFYVNRAKANYDNAGGFRNQAALNLQTPGERITMQDFAPEFFKNVSSDKSYNRAIVGRNGHYTIDTESSIYCVGSKLLVPACP